MADRNGTIRAAVSICIVPLAVHTASLSTTTRSIFFSTESRGLLSFSAIAEGMAHQVRRLLNELRILRLA
jgi:hypothetical protein